MSSALESSKMRSKNFPLDLAMLRSLGTLSLYEGGIRCILPGVDDI